MNGSGTVEGCTKHRSPRNDRIRHGQAAENLFLRKQLGLYVERQKKPRRATDSVRFTLAQLSRLFDGSSVLTVVKPDTLILWHRKGFPLLEVEVSVERTTASSDRCAGVNCRHGIEQSDLG